MPYIFKDDGYPEAVEFEDNYIHVCVLSQRLDAPRVEPRPARHGFRFFRWLARNAGTDSGRPNRTAAEPAADRR